MAKKPIPMSKAPPLACVDLIRRESYLTFLHSLKILLIGRELPDFSSLAHKSSDTLFESSLSILLYRYYITQHSDSVASILHHHIIKVYCNISDSYNINDV